MIAFLKEILFTIQIYQTYCFGPVKRPKIHLLRPNTIQAQITYL